MYKFRSTDFWKESIVTLPDNAFFELARVIFGKIKTPFNKQILAGDLERFLTRSDIRENITRYINRDDILIIAAVAALNEPSAGELETFFAGELSRPFLHDLLVNLEERFIVYRFPEKGQSRLALNPVLRSVLSPYTQERAALFPSISADEIPETAHKVYFDDRIFAALYSFASQNRPFFKKEGGVRRKALNAAAAVFPGLRLETVVGGMQCLGLFYSAGGELVPDYRRFSMFGGLSPLERLLYCAAGIACYYEAASSQELSPWLSRAKIRAYAESFCLFYNSLDPGRLYPNATLLRLAQILKLDNSLGADGQRLIRISAEAGLLVPASNQYWRVRPPDREPQGESAVIAMDSPFSVLVYPEIAYNDALSLAAVSRIAEAGLTVRFELNRDSAVSAFNRGISAEEITGLLRRLSHNRTGDNLGFTLADWEKRHREVSLHRGLVLTLSPEHRYLAQTKPLAGLIRETLAPGIYLLPETAEKKTETALQKAGVAIIARREDSYAGENALGGDENPGGKMRNFYQPLHAAGGGAGWMFRASRPESKTPKKNPPAPALKKDFHSVLNRMRLGKEERDELAARIDRRLILSESQLSGAVVRYEKLEAGGLDYAGKALIAKQAVSMGAPVEAAWTGRQKQERVFGMPVALEKTEGDTILVIENMDDSGGTVRIPLGKISRLRRIKKSIFENNL